MSQRDLSREVAQTDSTLLKDLNLKPPFKP
jgi:hypothetical protein